KGSTDKVHDGKDGAASTSHNRANDDHSAQQKEAALNDLRSKLKIELAKQRDLSQAYSQAMRNHSGFLGTIADGLQNTIGASANNKNPLLAFWGSHVLNKDEGSDRT